MRIQKCCLFPSAIFKEENGRETQGQNQRRKSQSFPEVLRLESVAVADPMFLSEPARTLGTWLRHCDWDTALPRMEQLYGSQAGLQPEGEWMLVARTSGRLRDAIGRFLAAIPT